MDKEFWRSIATNHFQVPAGFNIEQLTPELLRQLGASDPELRDYYIYTTLENWIQEGRYTHEQLRHMISELQRNLTHGLGEQGDDRVLLRSFSVLTLSEILKYDNAHPFLTSDEIQNILEQSINYLVREQDLRGHVPGKGWVHAIAHAGDLLGVLTRNRYIGEHELELILTAIVEKTTAPVDHVYITLEEERLALVVITALTRNLLSFTFWRWWCRQMAGIEEVMQWEDTVRFARHEDICAYHNTKMFLHSIYFQLTLAGYKLPGVSELIEAITNVLYKLDPGFYSVDVIKILDPEINTDNLRA
jgi:Protein of unknown function (DUF2785)